MFSLIFLKKETVQIRDRKIPVIEALEKIETIQEKQKEKNYWKYIAGVKSYSDNLLWALERNDSVQSVNSYNQIVKEICYGEIIDELFNVMVS